MEINSRSSSIREIGEDRSLYELIISMNEVEKILGESVTTQDFPIVLLQFYSHCMESISDYFIFENVPEDANSILENAKDLLARFEENEFFGYHKEVSEHSLDLLREAIDRMSSVIE